MDTFARSADLRGAEFTGADLRGARFTEADLSGVVMRGVNAGGVDIDDPFLGNGGSVLLVNGVDVIPFVEAELNRRFPGRAARRADDPDGLRAAWAALERAWQATLARVVAMPADTADVSAGGEWSFAQTLRHLVMATDMWLGPAVASSYAEVLDVRASRVAMVRDFLATVTPEVLTAPRQNPHDPGRDETVRSCLHVILNEEWEHLRYAVRDLDAIEADRVVQDPSSGIE
jgi:hypothetical protein